LKKLTNLISLSCNNNQLENLKRIDNLMNLTELYCSNNKLTFLNQLENLKVLDCSNNNFSNDKIKRIKSLNIKNLYNS